MVDQGDGSSPSGPKLQGVAGFFPCSRTGCINLETFPEVSNEKHGPIGGKCCSSSGNNTEDRVWEATLSSLKSKRVKGVKSSNPKFDYEIDSRNDMFFGGCPSCTHPSSSLVKVVPDDPQQGSVLTSPLEGNDPTHSTAEDQSNDDLTSRKEYPRIMFMNIADESKKTCAKIVDQLGGGVTSHGNMSTHVITGKARRTLNFCTALCSGAWIISPNWLKTSFREGKFVDELNFILEDEDFVLKYKSKLRNSVLRAKGNPCSLLKGYNVCLAKHIQPTVDILLSTVKSAGGTAQYVSNDPAYLGCKKEECKEDAANNGTCSVKTCSGSVSFHVVNIRTDVEFVFFSGGFKTPCILKRSDPVKFANPNKPLYGHLSSIDSTGTSMRLTWVSGDGKPQQVQYGDGKSISSTVTTFTQDDMCSSIPSPAKDFGWHEPGYIHSAVMTDLVPSQSFSYKYGRISIPNTGLWWRMRSRLRVVFQMPASGKDKPWYSIEQASVHFTIISTEHNWTQGGFLPSVDPDFVKSIEPLLLDNKVDLVLVGHVHNYERTCAVFDKECKGMPKKDKDGIDTYDNRNYSAPVSNAWSLSRYVEFGYVRVHATKEDLRVEVGIN
ncbi:putative inactive purple acid phosphatase 27 [Acorus calamus]|uniref:Inactive purple acid phosphatase 27 n=1 Tax=Acorus calamus TaxID=4465 RepID=A0AAV9EW52_ACOCL|nr:putative inactive purple acid phosphatase 27 [Acorus calamus]